MMEQEYKIYKKIHKYEYALDEEEGKIARERAGYLKFKKAADRKMKGALRDLVQVVEPDGPDEEPGAEDELAAKRELRNATVHKKRLRELEKREA